MTPNDIISVLPYSQPFLFVDELMHVDEKGTKGTYTFDGNSEFYKGHFKNAPVTPGVILTECCAQIGVVCLGVHLLGNSIPKHLKIALSSSEMEFYLPVFPNERVVVTSQKEYFRFHKLKCMVKMHNSEGKLVCKGAIAGMFKVEVDG